MTPGDVECLPLPPSLPTICIHLFCLASPFGWMMQNQTHKSIEQEVKYCGSDGGSHALIVRLLLCADGYYICSVWWGPGCFLYILSSYRMCQMQNPSSIADRLNVIYFFSGIKLVRKHAVWETIQSYTLTLNSLFMERHRTRKAGYPLAQRLCQSLLASSTTGTKSAVLIEHFNKNTSKFLFFLN